MNTLSTKLVVTKCLTVLLVCINLMTFASSQTKHIFLLAGQSNMAGQGGVVKNKWDLVVPPECRPNPDILKLNKKLKWEVAKQPLHSGIDVNVSNGIGPGMPFANSLLEKRLGYGVVGLVPCAISGTKIIQWQRGTMFYEQLLRRAKAALKNGGGQIEALLWYQGESDTTSQTESSAYKGRLQQFIMDLWIDLNFPDLLVIEVGLASGGRHYLDIVRQAQLHTDLPNVKCVDAMGLSLKADKLHLTTSAQVRLGNMLSDAFI